MSMTPEIKIDDNDNAIELQDLGIALETTDDKIIVLIDKFKSGYECKTCHGLGGIDSICHICEGAVNLANDTDSEIIGKCWKCDNRRMITSVCSTCQGTGAILVIPENAKLLPTKGIVVSMGEKCYDIIDTFLNMDTRERQVRTEPKSKIKLGSTVLFSSHVGTLIPVKNNIRLKIMRYHEPLCVVYGTDKSSSDFMELEHEQDFPGENK